MNVKIIIGIHRIADTHNPIPFLSLPLDDFPPFMLLDSVDCRCCCCVSGNDEDDTPSSLLALRLCCIMMTFCIYCYICVGGWWTIVTITITRNNTDPLLFCCNYRNSEVRYKVISKWNMKYDQTVKQSALRRLLCENVFIFSFFKSYRYLERTTDASPTK